MLAVYVPYRHVAAHRLTKSAGNRQQTKNRAMLVKKIAGRETLVDAAVGQTPD